MRAPVCPYCGQPSKLVDSKIIYGKSYGMVYDCRPCDAYVGVHRGTTEALGSLANKELRMWRGRAHMAFDPFWKDAVDALPRNAHGHTPRGEKQRIRNAAYARLAAALNIEVEHCHIAMFTVEQCKATVQVCCKWRMQ